MISTDQIQDLLGRGGTVVSQDGEEIGRVAQVYPDDQTGEPKWVTVETGAFGETESFIPLAQASVQDNEIRVPYAKDRVKDAPRIEDTEGHLTQDEEAGLYRHYGLDHPETASDSGPTTDDAMTGPKEQPPVGTENVTRTDPVSHDEVRLDREPIAEANRRNAMSGGDITNEEHEVLLTGERAVVAKDTGSDASEHPRRDAPRT
jgi:sporulation protein YlmC with PRC-barrel domain